MPIYPNTGSGDRLDACLATCDTLGRILDSVSDAITIDRSMRIISFNRAAAAITGFSRHEAVGRFFVDLFADGLFDAGESLRNALEKNEYVSDIEREIVGKSVSRDSLWRRSIPSSMRPEESVGWFSRYAISSKYMSFGSS